MGLFKKKQQSSDDVVAPDDPEAMVNLGGLAYEAGDLDAARAWYEQAAKLGNEAAVRAAWEEIVAQSHEDPAAALAARLDVSPSALGWRLFKLGLVAGAPSMSVRGARVVRERSSAWELST